MEDLYAILECEVDATSDQLRQAYRKLAKLYHPDKQADGDTSGKSKEKFLQISRALKVLGDPDLRKHYDSMRRSQETYQDYIVQEDVMLSEFDFDADLQCYLYECRCGGCYELSLKDVQIHARYVCCETCSLVVRILYDEGQHAAQSCQGEDLLK